MKAVLRVNLIALNASKKKLERIYTSSLTAHLKAIEQKGVHTPKRSRQYKIIKLRAERKPIETRTMKKKSTNPGGVL